MEKMEGDDISLEGLDDLMQEPLLDDADAEQHETFLRWVLLNADEIAYGDPSELLPTSPIGADGSMLSLERSASEASQGPAAKKEAPAASEAPETTQAGQTPGEPAKATPEPAVAAPRAAAVALPPATAVPRGVAPFVNPAASMPSINPLGFMPSGAMAMGLPGLPRGANPGAYLFNHHMQQQAFKMGLAASQPPLQPADPPRKAAAAAVKAEGPTAAAAASKKRDRSAMDGQSGSQSPTPPLHEKATAALAAGSAQLRKKKKPKIEELQERLEVLRSENSELSHHLTNVEQRHKLLNQEKKAMENLIRKQLEATQSGSGDASELARVIQDFKNRYADYGPQRQRECNFHMDQLERLLIPTQTTKMSLWTMEQPPSFFDDPNKNSLGAILKRELGVTGEQRERISSLRARVKEAVRDLRAAMSLLRDLRQHINHKHSSFDVRMRQLQDILTPTQAAKLILWVKTNRHKVRNGLNLTARDMFGAGAEYTDEGRDAGSQGSGAKEGASAEGDATAEAGTRTAEDPKGTEGTSPPGDAIPEEGDKPEDPIPQKVPTSPAAEATEKG